MKVVKYTENQPGWLFLDEDEAEKARHLFSDFEGIGTVDELGFGPLFDQVAKDLFPWCSTLTTRARYFFFSAVVIQRSLSKAVKPLSQVDKLDREKVYSSAIDSGLKYQRVIRDYEKYLAFMLHHKDAKADGLFGRRKINKWIKEETRSFSKYQNILQNNTRYPNRIYRGSCQELSMFRENIDEHKILEYSVKGISPFSNDWLSASSRLIDQSDYLFDIWDDLASKSGNGDPISFKEALTKLSPDLKRFSGFKLTKSEADFLYEKLINKSDYLKKLSRKDLTILLKSPELGLKNVAAILKNKDDQSRFLSAFHIDQVARPFRDFYLAIVEQRQENDIDRFFNWEKVISSHKWLMKHCDYDQWQDKYSDLIQEWIQIGSNRKNKDRHDDLKRRIEQRALEEVQSRGKTAPHLLSRSKKKEVEDQGLKEEIGFRESSFRLWNASTILNDIFEASKDV